MSRSVRQKGYLALAALLGVFYIAVGLAGAAAGDFDNVAQRVFWALAGSLSGASILAGLLYSQRAPVLGDILVAIGTTLAKSAVKPATSKLGTRGNRLRSENL